MNQINVVSASLLLLVSLFAGTTSSLAQTEGWLRGPGVKAGKESTEIKNPASNTQARPYYNPFND
jgi:hypothetical protein